MKEITRSELGIFGYAFFVVGVSDELGVDFAAASGDAVKGMKAGKVKAGDVYDRTPIRDLLAITRSAYFAGADAPFPKATPGAKYHGHRFAVAVPAPAEGWLLVRCASDQVVFERPIEGGAFYRAAAGGISLDPFRDTARFLEKARAAAQKFSLPGMSSKVTRVAADDQFGTRCAEIEVKAEPEGKAASSETSQRADFLFARFCYDTEIAHLGRSANFMHKSSTSKEVDRKLALDFFQGVTPTTRKRHVVPEYRSRHRLSRRPQW